MAENKELARLEMRVVDCAGGTKFDMKVSGTGSGIFLGLARLVNSVADTVGVPSGFLLTALSPICENLHKRQGSVCIDFDAVERAMGQEE